QNCLKQSCPIYKVATVMLLSDVTRILCWRHQSSQACRNTRDASVGTFKGLEEIDQEQLIIVLATIESPCLRSRAVERGPGHKRPLLSRAGCRLDTSITR